MWWINQNIKRVRLPSDLLLLLIGNKRFEKRLLNRGNVTERSTATDVKLGLTDKNTPLFSDSEINKSPYKRA